jgi:hypothetical protein
MEILLDIIGNRSYAAAQNPAGMLFEFVHFLIPQNGYL